MFSGEMIAVFDADFRPRVDFLDELLPYFDRYPHLGIVQSPQFFDVHHRQNWLERGAGAVQEYFYRALQHARQAHGGAICVGSNAVYRRAALDANGGTTLIEHSEDVHTGFDLLRKGWHIFYVPVVLAKGVCPNDLESFFRQQYRWCRGLMALLASPKFWQTRLRLRTRLAYSTGFLYYIHTAIMTIVGPLVPLALVLVVPEQAKLVNYVPLIPMFTYALVVFPLWHRSRYGSETTSVKVVYGWAHLFAVIDSLFDRGMEWHPTSARPKKSNHYRAFVWGIIGYSLAVGLIWTAAAAWRMSTWNPLDFLPVFLTGAAYVFTVGRIALAAVFGMPSRK